MALGNSHTYGVGAPMGMDYPAQLERFLNDERGIKYQVSNRGLRNINSTFIVENLEQWIKEDQPDLVFLMVGEPNYWNRYGYWDFLKEKNNEQTAGVLEKFDFLRLFSTYKFVELLVNREESWLSNRSQDYSNTFKGYKKNGTFEDKLYLGYMWLGSLEESDNFDFNSIEKDQAKEAAEMLTHVWENDKNPIAARLLAEFYFHNPNKFRMGLRYLKMAIDESPSYCYPCSNIINRLLPQVNGIKKDKLIEFQSRLNSKPNKVTYKSVADFVLAADNPRLSINERMRLAIAMSKAHPGSLKALNIIYHVGRTTHTEDYIEALNRTAKFNPLAVTGDIAQKIYSLRFIKADLIKRSDEMLEVLNNRFQNTDFKEIANINKLVGEWVIRDLERMLDLIHQSGAKAVVQTYPTTKSGPVRVLDNTLREWWKNKKNKSGIEFLDIELILRNKFQQNQDFYYATQLGPNDNHVNEHGYEEIAKAMLSFVPQVKLNPLGSN